jgi:outer membrane receptor protein involved in Fe transport
MDDGSTDPETTSYDGRQSGWYAQGIYQFRPRWRVGLRYDRLSSNNRGSDPTLLAEAGLDEAGHTPSRSTLMFDYSHSEYSRLRAQYSQDDSYADADDILTLQYIMSLGPHGAHQF